ncbi:MAG: transposase, partial [Candidatus Binatia bacterium]
PRCTSLTKRVTLLTGNTRKGSTMSSEVSSKIAKVAQMVDFDFVYPEVKDLYGYNGNVSVPPPMILKLMLLLVLYNVRSERELMATLPERLDWLWFLGLELDSGPV